MKILILSCNTGEGHNAAGRAVAEALKDKGHEAVFLDYMTLKSKTTSKFVGGAYVNVAKKAPRLFGMLYNIGGLISSNKRKSPVYFANRYMAKYLKEYIDENKFDGVVMPHLFPAETITYMKKKDMIDIPSVVICTDYTCIPFWEETECDYYILPHEDLIGEYTKKGLPEEKLLPYGIPVKNSFRIRNDKEKAKEKLGIPKDDIMYLVMSGSMGYGKLLIFVYEMYRKLNRNEHIVIICGNNTSIKNKLIRRYGNNKNIKIIGYTNHVSEYLDACDVIFTKPGGLTSTESIVKNVALVHTKPIPGCETKNMNFFTGKHLSVASKTIRGQLSLGKMLIRDNKFRENMLQCQKDNAKGDAGERIVCLLERICSK